MSRCRLCSITCPGVLLVCHLSLHPLCSLCHNYVQVSPLLYYLSRCPTVLSPVVTPPPPPLSLPCSLCHNYVQVPPVLYYLSRCPTVLSPVVTPPPPPLPPLFSLSYVQVSPVLYYLSRCPTVLSPVVTPPPPFPVLSVICSGVPSALSPVQVSFWSIICHDIPLFSLSYAQVFPLLYHLFRCPSGLSSVMTSLYSLYHMPRCSLCSITCPGVLLVHHLS